MLSLDPLGRNHFLRLHQTEILARGFDQPLKLDAQAARDFSQHAEGRVRRSLFDLRERATADNDILRNGKVEVVHDNCTPLQVNTFSPP